MINNDVLSSQAANRQRRHAADERARFDRISTDTAAREGVARQAGEAPTREEITRFANLMRSQGTSERPLDNGKPTVQDTRAQANPQPRLAGELAGMNSAERFRALMQQAFAKVDDRGADAAADNTGDSTQDARPVPSDAKAQSPNDTKATEAARAAQDAQARQPTDETQPKLAADSPKPDKATDGADAQRGSEAKKTGTGEAESAQQAAKKAADGEAQLGQAARVANGEDETEGGDTGSASSQAGAGSGSTPMSADMAQMPASQPQPAAQHAQQAAAAGHIAPALSELVQKHVKQMLVSDPRSQRGGRSREVLLRMQNDVLPGTDLWLAQTDDGWQLRADVRSRDAYDTLLAHQDELMQRFADSALGKLTIEPVYHG